MSASPEQASALRLSERLSTLRGWRHGALYAALGALGALGHPPLGWPFLTLLSLLFVIEFAPWRLATRKAALAGWAYGAAYFTVTLHWIIEPFLVDIARHGWMAPFAIALMAGGLALFWGAAFWFGAWRRSWIAFILGISLAEIARAHLFGGFPWGMHVTAFVNVELYQYAAWLGPHGLTLALLLALALPIPRLGGALLAAGIAAYGLSDPAPAPAPAEDAPLIRAVQPNAPQEEKWLPERIPVFLGRKFEATEAAPQAALVLWPEVAVPAWLDQAGDILSEAARRGGGAEIILGAQSFKTGQAFNSLAQIRPDGTIAATYDKWHLVPFGEYMPLGALFSRWGIYGLAARDGFGFAAGPGPELFDIPGVGRVQALICYEGIFAHEVASGVARPRLITIHTNDAWFGEWGGPAQHLAQAQARAIEQGLPVARSANTGISAIIDARGRVITSLPLGTEGHVDAPLPVALPPTFYARYGDLPFALLFGALLLSHIIGPVRPVNH